jgi:hypothetical protein
MPVYERDEKQVGSYIDDDGSLHEPLIYEFAYHLATLHRTF